MIYDFSERTFKGYLDISEKDVGEDEPFIYHTIHVNDFWQPKFINYENPFVVPCHSTIQAHRANTSYDIKGIWLTLNDFSDNFYGPLRLTLKGNILSGRRFLIFYDGSYYHGIETDKQFPIYDTYSRFEAEEILSRSPDSQHFIRQKGSKRVRFILTSEIPFDKIKAFEFVPHDTCIDEPVNCRERNFSDEEKQKIFQLLFDIRTVWVLEKLGFYEHGNLLFRGAKINRGIYLGKYILELLDLLRNRSGSETHLT